MSTSSVSTGKLIANILSMVTSIAVLMLGATVPTATIAIAACKAAISLFSQYDDIEALYEKLKDGDTATTAEIKAAITSAISADDALKAAITAAQAKLSS